MYTGNTAQVSMETVGGEGVLGSVAWWGLFVLAFLGGAGGWRVVKTEPNCVPLITELMETLQTED